LIFLGYIHLFDKHCNIFICWFSCSVHLHQNWFNNNYTYFFLNVSISSVDNWHLSYSLILGHFLFRPFFWRIVSMISQKWDPFYTPVSRRAVLCDWVWRAGVHTGYRTITLVLYIGTLFTLGSLGQRSRSPLL
jgi:hypothetical protein